MARIQLSGLVTGINGSIGGTTFQRNAYGHTIKNKPNTVNRRTEAQQERKTGMLNISKYWSSHAYVHAKKWLRYAQNYPIKSRLNPDSNLNGYNYYMKYNLIKRLSKTHSTLADPGISQIGFEFYSLSISSRTSYMNMEIEITSLDDTWEVYVFMTPPLSQSRSSIRENATYVTMNNTFLGSSSEHVTNIDISQLYYKATGISIGTNMNIGVSLTFLHPERAQIIEIPIRNVFTGK